jgi:uncharacterized protein (DUF488 family)
MSTPIYTIGYGSRSVEGLIALLQRYGIEYLADVRSQPYSKFRPEFTKSALADYVKRAGLSYVFLGDSLGGRPADRSCYVNDKVDYSIVRSKPFYLAGIERLQTAVNKELKLAIMCSEEKPQDCHRTKLVSRTLTEMGIEVLHIDENGELKTQGEVWQVLTNGQQSMFDDIDVGAASVSRKRYGENTP